MARSEDVHGDGTQNKLPMHMCPLSSDEKAGTSLSSRHHEVKVAIRVVIWPIGSSDAKGRTGITYNIQFSY